ncbi:MAG: hypothetical protein KJN62_07140 [Deltaproteobacteria bacterium]|nr:hypothetical protein [Deltaproteobacteria bacterium]
MQSDNPWQGLLLLFQTNPGNGQRSRYGRNNTGKRLMRNSVWVADSFAGGSAMRLCERERRE